MYIEAGVYICPKYDIFAPPPLKKIILYIIKYSFSLFPRFSTSSPYICVFLLVNYHIFSQATQYFIF